MKVLVTGSSGFIGRALCDHLTARGDDVVGVDIRPPAKDARHIHVTCDICDRDTLIQTIVRASPAVVIHLAARIDLLERAELRGYAANIDGVRNLIAAVQASSACRRVIYTSSQLVCRPGYVPSSPTDYCPHTLYGESKVETERIVRQEAGAASEWCLVRPTTVWGPGMSPHYQAMLRLIANGRYFHCGRSKLLKSYSYIGNITYQFCSFADAAEDDINGKTFYLADYDPLSLRQYADDIARQLGAPRIRTFPLPIVRGLAAVGDLLNAAGWRRFPFNSFRLHNILTEYVFDMSETRRICGALPHTYAEGLMATAAWFRTAAH